MKQSRKLDALLLLPGALLLAGLMAAPIALMVTQSLKPFVPGRAGAGQGFTLANYTELMTPAYALYFWDTFRIGLIVSGLGVALGTPIAWLAARTRRKGLRFALFGLLIGLLFMSLIARLYAIQMTWGATGPLKFFGDLIGIPVQSARYAEVQVVMGLLHFILPMCALMLIATFQNLNPRLEDAAASLGAPRWRVALDVTLPLATPGILAAFTIALAMCISNFVVPLILGRGVVLFTTNLMYTRFSDVANYPSGAAIGIIMLVIAVGVVYAMTAAVRRLVDVEGHR